MKKPIFKIGDLVEITMLGSMHLGKRALVVDRIMYTRHDHLAATFSADDLHPANIASDNFHFHPDEYSCRLKLLDPDENNPDNVMIRAKWIKHLSSVDAIKAGG